jgi:hypothetical protein
VTLRIFLWLFIAICGFWASVGVGLLFEKYICSGEAIARPCHGSLGCVLALSAFVGFIEIVGLVIAGFALVLIVCAIWNCTADACRDAQRRAAEVEQDL